VNGERANAWVMTGKGVCKLGVPLSIVAPYALLSSLQKLWYVASEKLITPLLITPLTV